MRDRAEAERLMARVDAILSGQDGSGGGGSGRSSRGAAAAEALPPSPYNRGAWRNLSEVLWPHWWLREAVRKRR